LENFTEAGAGCVTANPTAALAKWKAMLLAWRTIVRSPELDDGVWPPAITGSSIKLHHADFHRLLFVVAAHYPPRNFR
jgi:hypothetical protein